MSPHLSPLIERLIDAEENSVATGLIFAVMSDIAVAYEALSEIIIRTRPGRYAESASNDDTSAVSVQPETEPEEASVHAEPEDEGNFES